MDATEGNKNYLKKYLFFTQNVTTLLKVIHKFFLLNIVLSYITRHIFHYSLDITNLCKRCLDV